MALSEADGCGASLLVCDCLYLLLRINLRCFVFVLLVSGWHLKMGAVMEGGFSSRID